jgi:hypothetical protein
LKAGVSIVTVTQTAKKAVKIFVLTVAQENAPVIIKVKMAMI